MFLSLVSKKKVAGTLILCMFLLTVEFGPNVVLSCAAHTLLLTLQTSSAPCSVVYNAPPLLQYYKTSTVPFFLPLPQCSSVSFLLLREAEALSSGVCTVLAKASSSSVLRTCGDKKV